MKKVEYIVKTDKNVKIRKRIISALIIVILIAIAVLAFFVTRNVTASTSEIDDSVETLAEGEEPSQQKEYSIEVNMDVLDIQSILEENTQTVETKTLVVDEMDLDYTTIYNENSELAQGCIKTVQEGVDGTQQVIVVKTYSGNELISEERVTSQVTKAAINKVVEIGTGDSTYTYTPEVGDTLIVTPATLTIRKSNNTKSDKVITLKQDDEVTLVEILDDWYKVKYKSYVGYAQANCFTMEEEEEVIEFEDGVEYTKEELLASLSFDMELNKPSGLTLEQFKTVLSGNSGDTMGVIEDNAEYFYYAEKQYNINGIFLAAMAIHEGGWGTSKISQDKKNLFGYGAYDSNPYGGAYTFETYAEGIDLVARVLVKGYLNEKGTAIYDDEVATGTYYNGATLTGVNTRYASDKNWANSIYKWMTYLYNRLE